MFVCFGVATGVSSFGETPEDFFVREKAKHFSGKERLGTLYYYVKEKKEYSSKSSEFYILKLKQGKARALIPGQPKIKTIQIIMKDSSIKSKGISRKTRKLLPEEKTNSKSFISSPLEDKCKLEGRIKNIIMVIDRSQIKIKRKRR